VGEEPLSNVPGGGWGFVSGAGVSCGCCFSGVGLGREGGRFGGVLVGGGCGFEGWLGGGAVGFCVA
jgi:hypothetical protein